MEETGVVMAVEGNEATVRFERTEACKKCGACALGQDGEMLLRVRNELGAKTGDRMSVALAESRILYASLMAYGLPLIGLLAGVFLGSALARYIPSVHPDAMAVGGGAILTIAAYLVNRALEPARRRAGKYSPVPVQIHDKPTEEE